MKEPGKNKQIKTGQSGDNIEFIKTTKTGMDKDDYLRKKGILPPINLGIIYVFSSNREGVSEIKELAIWDRQISYGWRSASSKEENKINIINYKMEDAPYNISIWDDEKYGKSIGLGSGFGDLWSGSDFASLDRIVLEEVRTKESMRIRKKYIEVPEMVSKKEFYQKLLNKLMKLKSGEMLIDNYIEEVKEKINKYY